MKICVLGSGGRIGSAIVSEALSRGHDVTGVNRRKLDGAAGAKTRQADATSLQQLCDVIAGHDVVVSAVGPCAGESPAVVTSTTRALAAGAIRSQVERVVVVGGAGCLSVSPGVELLATQRFPLEATAPALAHREALDMWRHVKRPDWIYISPAEAVLDGERTGRYRVGHDTLLLDEEGHSRISAADFALAVVDEVENHSHSHERIGVCLLTSSQK